MEEERCREQIDAGRRALDHLDTESQGRIRSDIYIVFLAEFDAVLCYGRPECVASRAAFVAELKRLMVEPTAPSRPVHDLERYQHAQRSWLQYMMMRYDRGG